LRGRLWQALLMIIVLSACCTGIGGMNSVDLFIDADLLTELVDEEVFETELCVADQCGQVGGMNGALAFPLSAISIGRFPITITMQDEQGVVRLAVQGEIELTTNTPEGYCGNEQWVYGEAHLDGTIESPTLLTGRP
jgi:hypothetical protein